MPDKHFYFSIGASLGSVASYYIVTSKHKLQKSKRWIRKLSKKEPQWTLYFPIIIFLVGLWGLVPDIIHALNILPKEVTRGPIFNIFFLHSYFEWVENHYPYIDRILNWIGEIILFVIAVGVMKYYINYINKALHKKV